jgi:hypothetical protein
VPRQELAEEEAATSKGGFLKEEAMGGLRLRLCPTDHFEGEFGLWGQ